ncbi:MAG: type II toxin-antitoxin system HicA family toxin [Bacteroidales bacterium]|nr:type II toxin-antitoxin system HicA family toxin [Bacteroidales bacterium]
MKRNLLIKHLQSNGCLFVREGTRHSLYFNPENERTAAIPRHSDINDYLAKGICKELGIPIVGSN